MEQKRVFLLGKKLGMTRVYNTENQLIPVTVIEAGPCPIVCVKKAANEGYDAVQVAFDKMKETCISSAELGHLKKNGIDAHRVLREFRVSGENSSKAGEVFTVASLSEGVYVDVAGCTKGKGFQGVMKRYEFSGGPASHGSMFHRRGGSYGQREEPGRIYKGRKMPGHMGSVLRTSQSLKVIRVIAGENLLLVQGSVPGGNGSLLSVHSAVKKG